MGNRAIITSKKKDLGVYVHWNGGRDSVEAFLKYCELRGFRSPERDTYGWARLCQVLANYFGGDGLCVGIDAYCEPGASDFPIDNGVYVIADWQIVERVYPYDGFSEQAEYPLHDMLKAIDKAQPADQQLGAYLDADEVGASEIEIGDRVYVRELDGTFKPYKVVGIGADRIMNGQCVKGVPFVDRFGYGSPAENINNYLRDKHIRRAK